MGCEPSADGEAPSDSARAKHHQQLINVSHDGDIILSVTFLTSDATLRRARKAAAAGPKPPGHTNNNANNANNANNNANNTNNANNANNTNNTTTTTATIEPSTILAPKLTLAYRVSVAALTKHSKYFANLLTNPSFREAQLISSTHATLAARKLKVGEADPLDLPWVLITDDDEATQSAGRQHALEDMLRIMHGLPIKTARLLMSHMTTLAITADRFDCTAVVSRSLAHLKFKWPLTDTRPYLDEAGRPTDVEKVLRKKILVAWLLNQPMRLHQDTRELLIRGSRLWGTYAEEEADSSSAAWWNLPQGIEGKSC